MELNLKDKVIIVTGGSKGIGYGITTSLANEGAIPFIIGRNETDVKKAVESINNNGGKASYAIAELTIPEQCEQAIEKVVKEFGRIDGLVNNAGVNDGVGLEHGNYANFMRSIQRNVAHYYLMAHLALPYLKVNKGAIVNIGSKTSVTGQGGTSGYAAANGGRNSLTREWAVELLPYSIRVNAVIVAECYTPLYDRWIKTFDNPEEKLAGITQKIPLENRMTTAEEIADTVAFLLSDKSSHTTGQLIYVDGGYTHLDRLYKILEMKLTKHYFALDLKEDEKLIQEYKVYHQAVWPEIIESIKSAGIEDLEIYAVGNRLFMIMTVEETFSFEKKTEMDAANPKVQEWETLMWKYQQALPIAKEGEKWLLMEKIFQL